MDECPGDALKKRAEVGTECFYSVSVASVRVSGHDEDSLSLLAGVWPLFG
jgi:hypothetical protein